jgi:hypothetical protein
MLSYRDMVRLKRVAEHGLCVVTCDVCCADVPGVHLECNFNHHDFVNEVVRVFGRIAFCCIVIDYLNSPLTWAHSKWKPSFFTNIVTLARRGMLVTGAKVEIMYSPVIHEWATANHDIRAHFDIALLKFEDLHANDLHGNDLCPILYKATDEVREQLIPTTYTNDNSAFREHIEQKLEYAFIQLTYKGSLHSSGSSDPICIRSVEEPGLGLPQFRLQSCLDTELTSGSEMSTSSLTIIITTS